MPDIVNGDAPQATVVKEPQLPVNTSIRATVDGMLVPRLLSATVAVLLTAVNLYQTSAPKVPVHNPPKGISEGVAYAIMPGILLQAKFTERLTALLHSSLEGGSITQMSKVPTVLLSDQTRT